MKSTLQELVICLFGVLAFSTDGELVLVNGSGITLELPPYVSCREYVLQDNHGNVVLLVSGNDRLRDNVTMNETTTGQPNVSTNESFLSTVPSTSVMHTNVTDTIYVTTEMPINSSTSSTTWSATQAASTGITTPSRNNNGSSEAEDVVNSGNDSTHFLNETSSNFDSIVQVNFSDIESNSSVGILAIGQAEYVIGDVIVTIESPFLERSWVKLDNKSSSMVWGFQNVTNSSLGLYTFNYTVPTNDTECIEGVLLTMSKADDMLSVLYLWTQWGSWSPCVTTCEHVKRARVRQCPKSSKCGQGEITQTEQCNADILCSDWNGWSACSSSCGPGSRHRSRDCSSNASSLKCESYGKSICSLTACSEVWQEWTKWTDCSKSCGGGMKTRNRNCTSILRECSGNSTQQWSCNENICEEYTESSGKLGDIKEPVPLSTIIAVAVGVFMVALLVVVVILLRRLKWKKENTMYAISHGKAVATRSLSDPQQLGVGNFYTEMDFSCEPTSPTHIYIPKHIPDDDDTDADAAPSSAETRSNTSSFKLKHLRLSFKTVDIPDSADVTETGECSETESSGMPTNTERSSLHRVDENDADA